MADEIVGVHIQVDPGNSEQTVGDLRKQLAEAVNSAKQIGEQFGKSSQQFAAAQSNVRDISKSLQEASASASKVAEGIGKSEAPIKSMRTQIREALQDLVLTQEKFGDISPEAQKAAMKVADLRDRLKDANEVATLFDPEKKFQVVAGVAQGIAAGFSAAQGAMALFGGESKQVEQALLKVQAAMALSQGLSAVKASVEDFQRLRGVLMQIPIVQKTAAVANTLAASTMRLFGVATAQTGVAFNVLRGIILTTGIGVLLVGVGLLINKIIDWTTATDTQEKAQKRLTDAIDKSNSALEKNLDDIAYHTKKSVDQLKIQGAEEDRIREEQAYGRGQELKALNADYATKYEIWKKSVSDQKLTEDDRKKALDAATDANKKRLAKERENELANLDELAEDAKTARDDAEKKQKEADQKAEADAKKRTEEKKALDKAALSAQQETADELFAIQHDAEEKEQYELSIKFGERIAAYDKAGRDTTALVQAWEEQQAVITKKYADERAQAEQEAADKRQQTIIDQMQFTLQQAREELSNMEAQAEAKKQIAQAEAETRIKAAQGVSQALNGFAELAGEQTAAGKAFAVASATIQAILGAQQAFTSLAGIPIVGPALGALAAAGAIASGIANVKKILAVQVPGKGGAGSAPSISTNAPLSPQGPQTQLTQLNQDSINNMGNATVKAIVVESDITNSQQRISRIQNAAVFH